MDLRDAARDLVADYSHGMRKKLSLSAATDEVYAKNDGASNTDVRLDFGLTYYIP
mgnify:CR=1 FL=1